MKENLLSIMCGWIVSIFGMITGMICFNTLLEVVIYGAAGGAAGYMGKIIISSIHRKIKKLCSK